MNSTDVIIIADISGSMASLERKQVEAIKGFVAEFARAEQPDQLKGGHIYMVSIQTFGATAGEPHRKTAFKPASAYTEADFDRVNFKCTEGGTALLDAIGHAYTQASARGSEATLVQVVTDGGENASRSWSATQLGNALRDAAAKGNFTLAVTGPAAAKQLLVNCGLPDDNFRPWEAGNAESFRGTVAATTQAVTSYTQARSRGARSVSNYYTVDPSKLNTAGVRSMMAKVEPTEVQTVPKRLAGRAIADAFKKFEKGKHYYQLVKPEYLDADKELVVHIKDKGEYRLGSRSARILLGLPEDGRIRVKPAEGSAPYDIFVQSASVNRKLVEGQKLLTVP